jgi:hypothetical protein
MIEFLQDLLFFCQQLSHIDFTWPGYNCTSLLVLFGLPFYNVSRKGFTGLFREASLRLRGFVEQWEQDHKAASLPERAFHFDSPPVLLDNALGNRETQSHPWLDARV